MTAAKDHAGALVPAGWAAYNAVWLAVQGGLDAGRHGGPGVDWPIWVYAGAIAITTLFTFFLLVSRWRSPLGATHHHVSLRGDAGLCGALGVTFAGLAVVYGSWWVPLAGVMVVMAVWLAVKDAAVRRRRAA